MRKKSRGASGFVKKSARLSAVRTKGTGDRLLIFDVEADRRHVAEVADGLYVIGDEVQLAEAVALLGR